MQTLRRKRVILWGLIALLMVAVMPWSAQASDYGTVDLVLGSKGPPVTQLQKDLNELGFYSYRIDGSFAEKTRDAVVSFQKNKGLKSDGVVGPLTKKALNEAITQVSYGTQDLLIGSEGPPVTQLQKDLKELGFYSYSIDGSFAEKTRDAVVNFQNSKGLKPDGVVGSITKQALSEVVQTKANDSSANDLALGSQGPAVIQLQKDLNRLGFYSQSVDGDFGQRTHNAVVNFQKSQGLKTDGIVGPLTRTVLNNVLNGDGYSLPTAPSATEPTAADISYYNSHAKPIVDVFRAEFDGSLAQTLVGRAIWYMEYGFMKYGHTKYATTGFIDCSNFVSLVYKDFGYSITSAARNYGSVGVKVEGVSGQRIAGTSKYALVGVEKLKPGDIFTFWNSDEPVRTRVGHVALYMGVINGKPCIINTCSGHPTAIGIVNSFSYWYGSDLIEVRRVLPDSAFIPGGKITDNGPVIPAVYQIKPNQPIIMPQSLKTGF